MQKNTKKKIAPVVIAVLVVIYVGQLVAMVAYAAGLLGAQGGWGVLPFLLLYAGASMLLSAAVSLYLGCFSGETYSAPRLVSLSFTSLFFYAWIQMLMEWTWMNRLSFAAAPALWTAVSLTLLTARTYRPQILDGIPTAVFLVCAGVFALLYLKMIRTYSFEIRQIS